MTRPLVELGALLVLGMAAFYAYGEVREDRAEDRAERQRLQTEIERARAARASVDSAARLRVASLTSSIDSLEREASRLDTVIRVRADTVLALVPDTVRPEVEALVDACRARAEACDAARDSLRQVAETWKGRHAVVADSVVPALEALIREQEDQLEPGFFEGLFDGLGLGATCGLTTEPAPGCAVGVTLSL